MSGQGLVMLGIDQACKGLRIALLAHMPIGCPAKLSPTRLVTGLGHAREPEINAIGEYRSEEGLPILGRCLCAEMHESIAHTCPLIDLGEEFGNLDVRHQRLRLFSEGFRGFRGVFAQRREAQLPVGECDIGQCVLSCL